MREKAPAPAKYAPYAFAVRSLRDKPLLALCYAYGCEVRQKAAALKFYKSKKKKNNNNTVHKFTKETNDEKIISFNNCFNAYCITSIRFTLE
jgi:hypothetical protein